jgi:hypothetical protein
MVPPTTQWRSPFISMLVLVLLMLTLWLIPAPAAKADLPPIGTYEQRRTYYSDQTRTTIVGGWRYNCFGEIDTWGTETGYMSQSEIRCLGPVR